VGQPFGLSVAFTAGAGVLTTALGEVSCLLPGDDDACARCFAADADRGALHRLDRDAAALEATLPIDDGIGLPPRFLGRF
jgi:hypothetical protein